MRRARRGRAVAGWAGAVARRAVATGTRPSGLLFALVLVKTVFLVADHTVRLYLGDSAAFLAGAEDTRWLPTDRSFVYALLLRGLVWPTGWLHTLLAWQALAGVVVAWLLAWVLEHRLHQPRVFAVTAAVALALEPAQLYLERMVLAETAGLLAFVLFVAAASSYLVRREVAWLVVTAMLGVASASLRTNYLPVVLVLSCTLPLLLVASAGHPVRWRRIAMHVLLACCATAALHTGYRYTVARTFDVAPAYLPRAGFMQLGLVVPLVTPDHFERVGLPRDFETRLDYPIADRRARMAHMWAAGGLTRALREDGVDVERVARELSRMAIADNPLGLVHLGVDTVGDYFRAGSIRHGLDNDLGRRRIPSELLRGLNESWHYDATGLPTRVTPVSWYYEHTAPWWLVACLLLLAPLAALHLLAHWHTSVRIQALLLALVSVGLVLSHVLFVNVAFYRYLQPLPFFVFAVAVPLLARAWQRFGQSTRQRVAPGAQTAEGGSLVGVTSSNPSRRTATSMRG
jgi:hypothetical protein